MQGFYNFIDTLKAQLEANVFCNTVTYGDISRVDLNKTTLFPLAHFIVNNASYDHNVITYSVSLICMDVVDETDENVYNQFKGSNNEQDIFNTQQDVIVSVLDELSNGDLWESKYQLTGSPTLEPFVDRFENRLAGWTCTFTVDVVNGRSCG